MQQGVPAENVAPVSPQQVQVKPKPAPRYRPSEAEIRALEAKVKLAMEKAEKASIPLLETRNVNSRETEGLGDMRDRLANCVTALDKFLAEVKRTAAEEARVLQAEIDAAQKEAYCRAAFETLSSYLTEQEHMLALKKDLTEKARKQQEHKTDLETKARAEFDKQNRAAAAAKTSLQQLIEATPKAVR